MINKQAELVFKQGTNKKMEGAWIKKIFLSSHKSKLSGIEVCVLLTSAGCQIIGFPAQGRLLSGSYIPSGLTDKCRNNNPCNIYYWNALLLMPMLPCATGNHNFFIEMLCPYRSKIDVNCYPSHLPQKHTKEWRKGEDRPKSSLFN